jgi:hypothetical protein
MRIRSSIVAATSLGVAALTSTQPSHAAEPAVLPPYLADRGDGILTSLLGTYIRQKEFIFYPFYEYTRTNKFEYSPVEVGVPPSTPGSDKEFFGKMVEKEFLLFFAYAFSDSLAIELESAVHASVDFTKAPEDDTGTPATLKESGLGDTEMNLRWRFRKETETRHEILFFFKTEFPLQKNKTLLGTKDWSYELGAVLTKGYSWGTISYKLSAAYDREEKKVELEEWTIDYLKRINDKWKVALSIEGDQLDEVSLIGELQYTLGKNAMLKLNTGIGLTKKAPNWAPEIGVLFRF